MSGDGIRAFDPHALAASFETPLYVYDLDRVSRQVEDLRSHLPSAFDLAYAVKANPALAVVAHLATLGLGADVASEGELEAALRAGVRQDRIVLTGPGKPDRLLLRAVRQGIRAVTVESPAEFDRLEGLAAQEQRRVPLLLRLAAGEVRPGDRRRTAGENPAGKFGMQLADVRRIAARAARSEHVDLLGVHAFGASNLLDARALVAHAAATVEVARRLAAEAGFRLRLVDVGGGLGIPYATDEEPLDLAALGAGLRTLASGWAGAPDCRDLRVLLEPGRYLVGQAGTYLTRVVDVKTLGSSVVAIVDGGIHHLLRPALVGQQHRVQLLPVPAAPDRSRSADDLPGAAPLPVTVAGPLCTGLDVFCHAGDLREPAAGDLVAILDAGAYGFTESMLGFLSHPTPAEVAVRQGTARLIRPRLDPREELDRQRLPRW